jgi:hypothetical protein
MTYRATRNGAVLAESDDVVRLEGNRIRPISTRTSMAALREKMCVGWAEQIPKPTGVTS